MDPVALLFGFTGRINRARFWLGCLLNDGLMLLFAGLVLTISVLAGGPSRFGFNVDDLFVALDPAAWRVPALADLPLLVAKAAGTAMFVWIYLAVGVKRLHDRNRSGWWIVAYFVVPGLLHRFADHLGDSVIVDAVLVASMGLVLWGFVEMALLRGTAGDNRFGPDPLAVVDRRPGWDQASEVEMVPHKAAATATHQASSQG